MPPIPSLGQSVPLRGHWQEHTGPGDVCLVGIRVRGLVLTTPRAQIAACVRTVGTRENGVGDGVAYLTLLHNHDAFGDNDDLFTVEGLDIEVEYITIGMELRADIFIMDPNTEQNALHAQEMTEAEVKFERPRFTLKGRPSSERACIEDAFQDPAVAARVLLSEPGKHLRGRFVRNVSVAPAV